jgi:aspartate/methionine/tyrosine aminotransferase
VQDAAVEALRNGSNYTAAFRDRFRSRRDALLEALSGSTALRASIPAGGMFTLVDVTASGLPSDNFAERALDEANVAVVPGTAFSDRGEGFIRGSFARGEAEITEGARRLRGFAEALA